MQHTNQLKGTCFEIKEFSRGKKVNFSQAGMNMHLYCVFNTQIFAILKISTIPEDKTKCKTQEGTGLICLDGVEKGNDRPSESANTALSFSLW